MREKLYSVIATDDVDTDPASLSYRQANYTLIEGREVARNVARGYRKAGYARVITRQIPAHGQDPMHDGIIVEVRP